MHAHASHLASSEACVKRGEGEGVRIDHSNWGLCNRAKSLTNPSRGELIKNFMSECKIIDLLRYVSKILQGTVVLVNNVDLRKQTSPKRILPIIGSPSTNPF